MVKTTTKTFGEAVGGTQFYPDLPKMPLADALNIQWLIEDAKVVKDFKTQFGVHDFALLKFVNPEHSEESYTTICSGQVVIDRVQKAIDGHLFPLLGTISKVEAESGNEYYTID